MIKLIFKNLLAHRRRYFWILLEPIIVSITAWLLLDPAIITISSLSIPTGYDKECLVKISLAEEPAITDNNGQTSEDPESADIQRILSRLSADNRVEASTLVDNLVFESGGMTMNTFNVDKEPNDFYHMGIDIPGIEFFSTFGIIDVATGKAPTVKPGSTNDIYISESIADYLFPGENAVGHYIEERYKNYKTDGDNRRIIGVVNDALYRTGYARTPLIYSYRPEEFSDAEYVSIVLRLKPGVDVEDYIKDITPALTREMKSGKIYPHSPKSYRDEAKRNSGNLDKIVFITLAIATFFFINMFLAITGTFYLQTRRRSEDAGIMRTFGATPRRIVCEMIGEGIILVTTACAIGFSAYWFIARHYGNLPDVSVSDKSMAVKEIMPLWWDNFNTHFFTVSAIIYILLITIVAIGIYIPARRISRVNPVDALKDE